MAEQKSDRQKREHAWTGSWRVWPRRIIAAMGLALVAASAHAATYSLTYPSYTAKTDFTACGTGSCGNFSLAMNLQGTFTTSGPVPANLPAMTHIHGLVTSFSFSDGQTTYSSADGSVRVREFGVQTDAAGNIVAFQFVLHRWQAGAAPHPVGAAFDSITVGNVSSIAYHNLPCALVDTSPYTAVADSCGNAFSGTQTSDASLNAAVLPVAAPAAAPANVPTLQEWALLVLAAVLAATGVWARRLR